MATNCSRIMPGIRTQRSGPGCNLVASGQTGSSIAGANHGPLPPIDVEASGVAVNLNQFTSGARAVVVFYSPSCRICREVLPALQPLPSPLRLIMISESLARRDFEISEFSEAVFFYDRWSALERFFMVPTLPVILLVEEGGVIRDGFVGFHDRDWIQQRLKKFAGGGHGPASE
jgi:hypothetical protein